ncbi:MAG TPA: DNA repair protein RecO [Rubrivivax sp.]|nr:DNA repair protein RecO [Rubrivivax sp.]
MKRSSAAALAPGRSRAGPRPLLGGPAGVRAGREAAAKPLSAYVLHQYDWSESSLILEVFTRERGRMAVAAKGAKRPYSQLRGVLLPFQRLLLGLGRGGDDVEVHTLRSAEWAGGAAMPDGGALFAGFYLNELLLRLLARQDPHAALFDAYAQLLPMLAVADETRSQALLRAFELTLLRETGLLPELNCVTLTLQPVRAESRYRLQPETGIAGAPGGEPALGGAQWVTLQAALEHGSVDALCAACLPVLPVLRASLRALLQYHLGSAPLRTRQVMADLRRLLDPGVSPR